MSTEKIKRVFTFDTKIKGLLSQKELMNKINKIMSSDDKEDFENSDIELKDNFDMKIDDKDGKISVKRAELQSEMQSNLF